HRLAFVAFHYSRGTRVRLGGIAAEFAQRPALPQQIPALVELGLDVGKSLALVGGRGRVLEQLVLLGDQTLDVVRNLGLVFHVRSGWCDVPTTLARWDAAGSPSGCSSSCFSSAPPRRRLRSPRRTPRRSAR